MEWIILLLIIITIVLLGGGNFIKIVISIIILSIFCFWFYLSTQSVWPLWIIIGALIFAFIARLFSNPENKICPQCAEEIKFDAKICRFCGTDLEKSSVNSDVKNNPNTKSNTPAQKSDVVANTAVPIDQSAEGEDFTLTAAIDPSQSSHRTERERSKSIKSGGDKNSAVVIPAIILAILITVVGFGLIYLGRSS